MVLHFPSAEDSQESGDDYVEILSLLAEGKKFFSVVGL